jgi:hypothetical protein
MKVQIVFAFFISVITGDFTGCPMDGCESSLSHFVDLSIERFDKQLQWRRTDLVTKSTRGCIANDRSSVLCVVDVGYASINLTNGQPIWFVQLDTEEKSEAASLPVINNAGFSIIANNTRCTLINPEGNIAGTFNYTPRLLGAVAGPFVTDDGQIIIADSVSVSIGLQKQSMIFIFPSSLSVLKIPVFRWVFKPYRRVTFVNLDR